MQNGTKAAKKTKTSLSHKLMACVISALLVLSCTGIAYAFDGQASDVAATTEEEASTSDVSAEESSSEEAADTEEAEETTSSDSETDKASTSDTTSSASSSDVSLTPSTLSSAVTPLASSVSYIDENGNSTTYTGDYTSISSSNTPTSWSTGWYVVTGTTTISSRITVSGNVNLILTNGYTLTASYGITVNSGASLTIYAQSVRQYTMGTLIANRSGSNYSSSTGDNFYRAGIGSTRSTAAGKITINGGIIYAYGSYGGAGIGGGWSGSATSGIYINGGYVYAYGGCASAGIGGGLQGVGANIYITGGTVTARTNTTWSGSYGGAGIGGGAYQSGYNIYISGGTVTAAGGGSATNGYGGAGIGGGYLGGNGYNIYISGGTVTATGYYNGAGIGSGGGTATSPYNIVLSGGYVIASSRTDTGISAAQAIGSGSHGTNVAFTTNYSSGAYYYHTSSTADATYGTATSLNLATYYLKIYAAEKASVSFNPDTATIQVNDTLDLTQYLTVVIPSDHSLVGSYVWTSGNTTAVTVDSNGMVTGLAVGTAVITVSVTTRVGTSSSTDTTVSATFTVTVVPKSVVATFTPTIYVGGSINLESYLTSYFSTNYPSYSLGTWSVTTEPSGNVSRAASTLTITGVSVGSDTIVVSAPSSDGNIVLTATFNITVLAAETGPSDTITIAVGETTNDLTSYFTSYSDYSLDGYSAAISTGGDSFIELSSDSSFTAGSYVIKYTGKSAGTATVTVTATSSTTGKAVVGTFNIVVKATTFTLTIYKYTGADETTETPLEGAQFSVEKVTDTATGATETVTLSSNTTNSNGEIIIEGLELDTIYKISETKVPSGYVVADPVYIKVVNEDGTLTGYLIDPTTWDMKSGTETMLCNYTTKTDSTLTTFAVKIQNTQLESMPQTGFSGALLVFAAGGAIVAAGFYVLFGRKSKLARAAHAPRL